MMNKLYLFLFILFFVLTSAQKSGDAALQQHLLFRTPITLKDYGLQGKVKKVEIITSYSDKTDKRTYQTLYFSDEGLLIKNNFYREKEDESIAYYHYDNSRLDSITMYAGTGKEKFSYDSNGRLTLKTSYGKYEDNKDEMDETEEYHYNSQGYIIKSVKSNLVLECRYTAYHQIKEVKSYYTDQPSDISSTEYQYTTFADKPDLIISKKNGKVQETTHIKYDNRKNAVETVSVYPDKTRIITTHSIHYDSKGNILSSITSINGKETTATIQKIEYTPL